MLKIAIVEDEALVLEKLSKIVVKYGYEICGTAGDSDELYNLVQEGKEIDLLLMDIGLGGKKDGTKLALEFKEKYNIPSIFISGYTEEDTLKMVNDSEPLGFIVKPYKHKDIEVALSLAAKKIGALKQKKEQTIKFEKGFTYNIAQKQMYKNDKMFDLTNNENKFICALAEDYGNTIDFKDLFTAIWGKEDVGMTSIRNLVKRIRDKMGIDIIDSVWGSGYRLK